MTGCTRHTVWLLLFIAAQVAGQPECPRYPVSQRNELSRQLTVEREALAWARRASKSPGKSAIARKSFIDEAIFAKMEADGVASAPLSDDATFLRRVSIDLTGQIPTYDRAAAFIEDPRPYKRIQLVEEILNSPAYADQLTLFFANKFQITSGYGAYISPTGRNLFNQQLREFVAGDLAYDSIAREIIGSSGAANQVGAANFIARGWSGDPIQDNWDTLTDRVTTIFLGYKTECVSCHNGRGHLEKINLWLSDRTRREFWRMSAFFSRTEVTGAGSRVPNVSVVDRREGSYTTDYDPAKPGQRPRRSGGPYTPVYITSGVEPQSSNWRQDLGQMVTTDRQFAKATVNYLWAYLFNYGLVDPPDAWDLARVDPKNPPPEPWTLQVTHPELLEQLADYFIQNNYRIKPVIRLLVNSSAYQLSSQYEGTWQPQFTRYFAKHIPRRLSAEEIFDALQTATETGADMAVTGIDRPLRYANQLPDVNEPRTLADILLFLKTFGRGNWIDLPRDSAPGMLQLLYFMNNKEVVFRTGLQVEGSPANAAERLAASSYDDEEVIKRLFVQTLGRYPTPEEAAVVASTVATSNKSGGRREWVENLQWALLNKLDFIFNY
jgi:hypothetical protein